MAEETPQGIAMAVTGGGVAFDSAPGLHDWMKNVNEYQDGEEWDLNPALAVLFHDPDSKQDDVLLAEFWDTMGVKPYEFLRVIAAALLKVAKEHKVTGRPVAASFFCEGWGYAISTEEAAKMPELDQSLLPNDWKERAELRLEAKTVITVAVASPELSTFVTRIRGKKVWDQDMHQTADQGNVASAMRSLVRFLDRKTREETTQS